MDQDRITSTEVAIKTPTTLENIPEDVAGIIAEQIQGWARIEGDLDEREKARRTRDSTLRAVALSSRRSHEIYRPILWQNVTLDLRNFFSFCQALKGDERLASSVRLLHINPIGELNAKETGSINSQLASASTLNSKDLKEQTFDGMLQLLELVYGRLIYLQSLVIITGVFIPSSLLQLSCFSTSLKKLFIPLVPHSQSETRLAAPLNARNFIWLLTFGSIEEAALGFTVSSQDFDFLVEHHEYFSGTSNVKKLSLAFQFVYQKWDKTSWDLPEEKNNGFKHGNKKSEAIALLLEVVNNQLQCLELYPTSDQEKHPGNENHLSLRCLLNLGKSLRTLHHLRIMNCYAEKLSDEISPFPLFRCLKMISLKLNFLYSQVNLNNSELPVSLERIALTYYLGSKNSFEFTEDEFLAQLIRSQFLPNLKEVVVPSAAIDSHGRKLHKAKDVELWAQKRRELENEEVFKSGKVRLTKADKGCSVIPDSQIFMSHVQWLSPPF